MDNIKHIKFEDAPESWFDRCSGDGYDKYTNENGERIYSDIDMPVGELGFRPCAKCGKYPTLDGDDACISNLGKVVNACCGHDKNKGYIQFDNGTIIRGYFEIERLDDPYPINYEVRSRIEIFDKIKELESSSASEDIINILKWVMKMD